jgi:fructose-bisphosphate aldolase class 1
MRTKDKLKRIHVNINEASIAFRHIIIATTQEIIEQIRSFLLSEKTLVSTKHPSLTFHFMG